MEVDGRGMAQKPAPQGTIRFLNLHTELRGWKPLDRGTGHVIVIGFPPKPRSSRWPAVTGHLLPWDLAGGACTRQDLGTLWDIEF